MVDQFLRDHTADLHIHTCLSPCACMDMSPKKIVAQALEKRISIIAITDHNTAENAEAVMKAAHGHDLYVLPGMEITTVEEVHIIALFENMSDTALMQEMVYQSLPQIKNDERLFGMQVISDEEDYVKGFFPYLLINATGLSLEETVESIHRYRGLAIAAHIDREQFSIPGQLGFIPRNLELDAAEISTDMNREEAVQRYGISSELPLVKFSDSHEPGSIGSSVTNLLIGTPSFSELRMALKGENGRGIL